MGGGRRHESVLGVLGGMGPAATLDFLAKLQRTTPALALADQDHLRVLVDLNPKVPDHNAALAGRRASPAPTLVALAAALVADGAKPIVSGCTEVSLVLGVGDLSAPLMDSTDVRVAAALAFTQG